MIDPMDLHAFVDGELSSNEADAVKTSMATSPSVAREVEAIRNLKVGLRANVVMPDSADAWKACTRRLDELDKTKRIESLVGRFAPAMCATLFVGILLVGRFSHHSDGRNYSGPDLARAFGTLSTQKATPNGLSKDMARWEDWLIHQSKTSTPDHLTLRGVKTGFIDGIPVTQLSARDQNGDFKIYEVRQPIVLDGMQPLQGHADLQMGMLNGENCVVRQQGQSTLLIVGDRNFEDLATVAAQVTIR